MVLVTYRWEKYEDKMMWVNEETGLPDTQFAPPRPPPTKEQIDEEKSQRIAKATYDLVCDSCGRHLAWVYECDLNGSYFYCDECKESQEG